MSAKLSCKIQDLTPIPGVRTALRFAEDGFRAGLGVATTHPDA